MSTSSKKTIYALLAGFGLFLLGSAAVLWVENKRIQRQADELGDLRYELVKSKQQVNSLHRQLRDC